MPPAGDLPLRFHSTRATTCNLGKAHVMLSQRLSGLRVIETTGRQIHHKMDAQTRWSLPHALSHGLCAQASRAHPVSHLYSKPSSYSAIENMCQWIHFMPKRTKGQILSLASKNSGWQIMEKRRRWWEKKEKEGEMRIKKRKERERINTTFTFLIQRANFAK